MQTIEFLQTAKWIISQFSEETKNFVFTDKITDMMMEVIHTSGKGNLSQIVAAVMNASHEMVVVREKLAEHPLAPEVLKAFKLEALLNNELPLAIARAAAVMTEAGPESPNDVAKLLSPIWRNWKLLTQCLTPIESLTIPKEIVEEQDFDEILTIELRYIHQFDPQAQTISTVLTDVTKLYEAVAIACGKKEFSPLLMIYASSGSSFRFDFKGLGEPIKQIKELLVEGWKRIRHRKPDDFHHNVKATLEGLNLLSKIHSHRQQNVIDSETAIRLNEQVVKHMVGLFEAGALPREIHIIETVSNQEIMQGIQQKLLPPAPSEKKKGLVKSKKGTRHKTKKPSKASDASKQ